MYRNGTEQQIIITEVSRVISIVRRSAATNQTAVFQIVAANSESLHNLVKFASAIQMYTTGPGTASKDCTEKWHVPEKTSSAKAVFGAKFGKKPDPFAAAYKK